MLTQTLIYIYLPTEDDNYTFRMSHLNGISNCAPNRAIRYYFINYLKHNIAEEWFFGQTYMASIYD